MAVVPKQFRHIAVFSIAILCCSFISNVFAVGESAVITLVFPPGARATGLGEAFVAIADDANATFFNPAGLGQAPLANSWKGHLTDSKGGFTAIASKRKSEFGLKERIWAGTGKGLYRFNGKVWESYDVYLIESDDDLKTIAHKYIKSDDEKLIEDAAWQIQTTNGIGMSHYATVNSLLGKNLKDSLLRASNISKELVARKIVQLPVSDRTSAKVYGIVSQYADSLKADTLSDKIAKLLKTDDVEFSTLVELKIPFTLAVRDSVTALAIDQSDRLWVGTPHGLWRLDELTWNSYTVMDGLPSNKITTLTVGPFNEIAIGTDAGMAVYNNGQFQSFGAENFPDSLITSLAYAQSGVLYAGTSKGLVRKKDSTFTVLDTSKGILSNNIRALYYDSHNRLWIGGDNGVSIFDETTWKRFKFPQSQVSSINEQSTGTIWIGTNKGAITYKTGRTKVDPQGRTYEVPPEWKVYHSKNALKGNDVRGVAVHGGDVWVATEEGINQYDNAEQQVLLFYEPLLPAFGIKELWHTYGAYVLPTEDWGTLGFSINFINMGTNEWTDDLGRVLGKARSWEGIFGLSYGVALKEDFSVGLNVKYVNSALAPGLGSNGEGVGHTFAVDAGLLKRNFYLKNLDYGLQLQNMGPNIFYISRDQADPLPFTIRTGVGYHALQSPIHDLKLLFDLNREIVKTYIDGRKPDPFYKAIYTDLFVKDSSSQTAWEKAKLDIEEINFNMGIEYWYANFLALRTGFLADYIGERYEWTFGLGLQYGNLNFDWSYIFAPEGFMKPLISKFDPEKGGANGARDGQWRGSFLFKF